MSDVEIATLGVEVDASGVKAGSDVMASAEKNASNLADAIDRLSTSISSSFGKTKEHADGTRHMSEAFREAGQELRNMARELLSFLGIAYGLKEIIELTAESEKEFARLKAVLKATGEQTDDTANSLKAYAKELSALTGIGDDNIVKAEAMVASFRHISHEAIPDIIKAAADMSAAFGGEVSSTAFALGKALEDPQNHLTLLGREIGGLDPIFVKHIHRLVEAGQGAKAQAEILELVRQRTGGVAEAMGDTLDGALKKVRNSFQDLLKAEGNVDDLKEALNKLNKELQDPRTVEAFGKLTAGIATMVGWVIKAVAAFTDLATLMGEMAAQSDQNPWWQQIGIGLLEAVPGGQALAAEILALQVHQQHLKEETLGATDALKKQGEASHGFDRSGAHPGTKVTTTVQSDPLVGELTKKIKEETDALAASNHELARHLGALNAASDAALRAKNATEGVSATVTKNFIDQQHLASALAASSQQQENLNVAMATHNNIGAAFSGITGRLTADEAGLVAQLEHQGVQHRIIVGAIEAQRQAASDAQAASTAQLTAENDMITQGISLLEAKALAEAHASGLTGESADAATRAAVAEQRRSAALQEVYALIGTDDLANYTDQLAAVDAMLQTNAISAQQAADAVGELQNQFNKKQLSKLLDHKTVEVFDDLAKSMERLGTTWAKQVSTLLSGFGKLTQAYAGIGKLQDQVAKQGGKASDEQLDQMRAMQSQVISSYADMADSAAGFFKQGSDGYKALHAAAEVFHVAELAMAVVNAARQLGLISAVTAAKVTGAATAAGAATTAAATESAAAATTATAHGTAAVAAQASAGPYVGFVLAAAMAAMLISYGVKLQGSNGGGGAPALPTGDLSKGTGTVLGDPTKASESIKSSIDLLSDYANKGLQHTQTMIGQLQSIDNNIKGLGAILFQVNAGKGAYGTPFNLGGTSTLSGGFVGSTTNRIVDVSERFHDPVKDITNLFSSKIPSLDFGGQLINSVIKGIIGSTKLEQTDTGLLFKAGQTLADALAHGASVAYFATVKETTSHIFGIGRSESYSDVTAPIESGVQNAFDKIIGSLVTAATTGAEALGGATSDIQAAIDKVALDFDKISFQGLSAEEIQTKLSEVFSALGDRIAEAASSVLSVDLTQFQQAGEGLFQTLSRVASSFEYAQSAAISLDLPLATLQDVLDAGKGSAADLGTEMLRLGVANSDMAQGVKDLTDGFVGSADEMASFIRMLEDLTHSLKLVGIAQSALTGTLITAAGGSDALASNLDLLFHSFTPDKDQTAALGRDLSDAFGKLGQTLPATREGLEAWIKSATGIGGAMDLTTESGQKLFGSLLKLLPELDEYYKGTESAAADLAKKLDDLQQAADHDLQDAVDKFDQGIKDAANTLAEALGSIAQARDDVASAIHDIESQRAGYSEVEYQQGIISRLRSQLTAGSITDQITRVQDLRGAIYARYSAEIDQVNKAREAAQAANQAALQNYQTQLQAAQQLAQALKQVKAYVDGLKTSDLSPLTPKAKLDESRRQFESALQNARGGDAQSVQQLQQYAQAYLSSARTVHGGTEQYVDIFNEVQRTLSVLADRTVRVPSQPTMASTGLYDAQIAEIQDRALTELQDLNKLLNGLEQTAQSQNADTIKSLNDQLASDTKEIKDTLAANQAALVAASKEASDAQIKATEQQTDQLIKATEVASDKVARTVDSQGDKVEHAVAVVANAAADAPAAAQRRILDDSYRGRTVAYKAGIAGL